MSGVVAVTPGRPSPEWTAQVPGSKSLTNRALVCAGLAAGTSRLRRPLDADDTRAMAEVLRGLGASVSEDGRDWLVGGLSGPPTGSASLYCGMGATVGRFVLPMLAAGDGRWQLDAHPQLRRRPLGPMLAALRAQGARIQGESFPLALEAVGLRGGEVAVDTSVSSQFLSGLLLAAPYAAAPVHLRFGALVSAPYVELTRQVMAAFGVSVNDADGGLAVPRSAYAATGYAVEPDASTASYFLAAAAMGGTEVAIPLLSRLSSAQGDLALVDHLVSMGAALHDHAEGLRLRGPGAGLGGAEVDMADASDVFMTLACVAPFAAAPTTITGLGNVRVKESDRLAATAENLRRLGIEVDEGPDWLRVHPGEPRPGVRLPTYDDHRIAMAFALIGLRVPVELEDPDVVAKTCPGFWELWPETGAEVTRW